MAVSRHVDAENRAQVLCKRSPGSQPLRMSSVPFQHCKIVVKFMLATNIMREGEGSFTTARWVEVWGSFSWSCLVGHSVLPSRSALWENYRLRRSRSLLPQVHGRITLTVCVWSRNSEVERWSSVRFRNHSHFVHM